MDRLFAIVYIKPMTLNTVLRLTSRQFPNKISYNYSVTESLGFTFRNFVRHKTTAYSHKFLKEFFHFQWYDKASYCHSEAQENRYIDFKGVFTDEEKYDICKNMIVYESFLSTDDEKSLMDEIGPYMRRLHYEFDHWDNAIHGFRETERLNWNEENTKIINRVRNCAFPPGTPQLRHVHILDLSEEGYIKPHIDSVRFCGNTIAGLSLLTDAVMRLVNEKDKTKVVDILLKRCSLYIMRDSVRYDYTHEVLQNKGSVFRQEAVEKKRRISIICRNEPSSHDSDSNTSKRY